MHERHHSGMLLVAGRPCPGVVALEMKLSIILTGHENELGHSVDHREAYWITYDHTVDCPYPVLVMSWGEPYPFP